jgi:hypothetical protein
MICAVAFTQDDSTAPPRPTGEQLLNDPLGTLVVLLTEVVMPDPPLRVREVERGPGLVPEGTPDREVVVHRDRIVHAHIREGGAHLFDLVLEWELRRVCADHHQAVVSVPLGPGADVGKGAQPIYAREGAELDDDHLPTQPRRVSGSELSHRVAPPRSGSEPSMGNSVVAVNAVT